MEGGGSDVVEGFICPMCLKDLKTPVLLAAHFEDVHASENDLMQQLRSVFGKAKKKIFKDEHVTDVEGEPIDQRIVSRGTPGTGGIDIELWEPQEFGAARNCMGEFKNARKLKIESYVVEINKNLIRLEKLVKAGIFTKESSLPAGAKMRKSLERSVVHWENDNEVKFCPHCGKKFNVTFRRHHCRLCGKVMCSPCSDFLLSAEAGELLKMTAVSSLLGPAKGDEAGEKNGLRICTKCKDLMERRRIMEQQKLAGTELVRLYNLLKEFISEADRVLPAFRKIAASVNAGETEFGLERAFMKRKEVYVLLEKVDAVSKRILTLGTSDPEKPPSSQALRLQRAIASLVASYLQDNMIALPALPSAAAYSELVKTKEAERKRREERIRAERLSVANSSIDRRRMSRSSENIKQSNQEHSFDRSDSLRLRSHKKQGGTSGVGRDDGTRSLGSSPDPMLQQMEIIKDYIRKARNNKQYDNIELFENNLRELEREYSRQLKLKK